MILDRVVILFTALNPFLMMMLAISFSKISLASKLPVTTTMKTLLKDFPCIFSLFTQTPLGSFVAVHELMNTIVVMINNN